MWISYLWTVDISSGYQNFVKEVKDAAQFKFVSFKQKSLMKIDGYVLIDFE